MTRVFIDTNVPMYAAGRPHPLRDGAQATIRHIVSGELDAVTDSEVFREILYRYFFIGEREKGLRVFDSFLEIMKGRVLPVTEADLGEARRVAEQLPMLHARDLVHLAVMRNNGISTIITADEGFKQVAGVTCLALGELPSR